MANTFVDDLYEFYEQLMQDAAVGEVLKAHFPNLKELAVEPALSPVISGGAPGSHPIQGTIKVICVIWIKNA